MLIPCTFSEKEVGKLKTIICDVEVTNKDIYLIRGYLCLPKICEYLP